MTTQNVVKKPVVPIKTTRSGIVTALIAFCIWGAFPLYFKQLAAYNATEIIGHRIVWTFACLLIVVVVTKRWQWIDTLKQNPKWIALTFLSGIIIATSWGGAIDDFIQRASATFAMGRDWVCAIVCRYSSGDAR